MKHTHPLAVQMTALAAALIAFLPPTEAHAQQNAVTPSGGLIERAGDDFNSITGAPGTSFVVGYSFTVSSAVAVSALGFYDDNNEAAAGTAMQVSHSVGIFSDTAGTLLVQATVSPTDRLTQSLADGALFRYDTGLKDGATDLIPLPSFLLLPGQTYVIAAVTGNDYYDYLPDTFSTAPLVTYGQDRYVSGNATNLQRPTQTYGDDYGGLTGQGFFGPSFQFAPAPEPSDVTSLVLGALGLMWLTLRARRRPSRPGAPPIELKHHTRRTESCVSGDLVRPPGGSHPALRKNQMPERHEL